jgi:hypothetical protein
MGYVIAAVVVLLLVAGFITFLMLNATKRKGTPADIAAPDESPLGDSAEHSDATHTEGRPEGTGGDRRPRVGDPGAEAVASEPGRGTDRST